MRPGALLFIAARERDSMDHTDLPRWRGFNIQNKFVAGQREEPFRKEDRLGALDDAVTYASRHDVHLNLNLHRAPGFTAVARRKPTRSQRGYEPMSVSHQGADWVDSERYPLAEVPGGPGR